MYNSLITLTDEKFQEIYTNQELRNAVAGAHKCCDEFHNFKHFQAMAKHANYIVTEEQINLAKKETEKAKQIVLDENKNKLLFSGMGSGNLEIEDKKVANYRFRTVFKNRIGSTYFIEFVWHEKKQQFYTDHLHCIAGSFPSEHVKLYNDNYRPPMHYVGPTEKAVLEFINETFDCNFNEVVIDEFHWLNPDKEALCTSPK